MDAFHEFHYEFQTRVRSVAEGTAVALSEARNQTRHADESRHHPARERFARSVTFRLHSIAQHHATNKRSLRSFRGAISSCRRFVPRSFHPRLHFRTCVRSPRSSVFVMRVCRVCWQPLFQEKQPPSPAFSR